MSDNVTNDAKARARGVLHRYAISLGQSLTYNDVDQILDSLLEALGYTLPPKAEAASARCRREASCSYREAHDHGPACDKTCQVCGGHWVDTARPSCGNCGAAVDLTPAELREAATLVEGFAELHHRTVKITDSDDIPPTWKLPITYAELPVAVVCSDAGWVLRIGGDTDA